MIKITILTAWLSPVARNARPNILQRRLSGLLVGRYSATYACANEPPHGDHQSNPAYNTGQKEASAVRTSHQPSFGREKEERRIGAAVGDEARPT